MTTAAEIRAELLRHTFTVSNEVELHEALQDVLDLRFPGAVEHEVTLHSHATGTSLGRIDFMVDEVGIEVKVGGQPAAVRRQLARYQRSPRVSELMLVTTRGVHATDVPRGVDIVVVGGTLR